jgi:hypothetical protein
MRLIAILGLLFFIKTISAQNLIVNGDAELQPGTGWTIVQGGWVIWNAGTGGITPHGGSGHFAVSNGGNQACPLETSTGKPSEMYQDIDVSSNAVSIDAGTAQYNFSGWYATYNNQDYSRVIIEYRTSANVILSTYDSGQQRKPGNVWTKLADTRIAQANTRIIRIRLISKCGGTTGDDDGYYDDLSLTVTTIVAPVKFLYFTAQETGETIQLTWATASEKNNDYFTIEKSTNGITWFSIGQVPAGNTTQNGFNYEFTDYSITKNIQYYRLKQTDKDGSYEYSNQILIHSQIGSDIEIYPNPFKDKIELKTKLTASIEIYTTQGSLIYSSMATDTENTTIINTENLTQGLYLFKITTENETQGFVLTKEY